VTARTAVPDGTIRRRARVVSTVIAVLCVTATLVGVAMTLSTAERVPVGRIVVVGDLDTPGMRAVVAELTERVENGDDLVVAEADPVAGLALLIPLAWLAIGMLIVWRQPTNCRLFILTGAASAQPRRRWDLRQRSTVVHSWACGLMSTPNDDLIPLLFLLYRTAACRRGGGDGPSTDAGSASPPGVPVDLALNNWRAIVCAARWDRRVQFGERNAIAVSRIATSPPR
jgi:hypothetical protein